mmetsp:Transcript_25811/g.55293  ORF Transcript_25811/g.55293 Transcript_25811/m.55293 type:complete len:252 (+) Transcript_25811:1391-2146(+)
MRAVDDRGQTEDHVVAVVDDRVDGGVFDDVQVLLEFEVGLVEFHEVLGIELPRLLQRREDNLLRGQGLVSEGPLEGVQVVRADGDERPLAAQVLVQLVLQVDEGLVRLLGEGDPAQRGAHDVRANERRLRLDVHGLNLVALRDVVHEGRRGLLLEEDAQRARDALDAEQVVAVGRDVDLVDDFLVLVHLVVGQAQLLPHHLLLRRHVVQLDAELEAQVLELLIRVRFSELPEELVSHHRDRRHLGSTPAPS